MPGTRIGPAQLLDTCNGYLLWAEKAGAGAKRLGRRCYVAGSIGDAADWKLQGQTRAAEACLDGAWSALRGQYGPRRPWMRMPAMLKRNILAHPYCWIALLKGRLATTVLERVWQPRAPGGR